MDLKKFREEINKIDDQILELLAQRRRLVGDVIEYKEQRNLQLRDVHREEQLLDRLIARGRQIGLDAHAVTTIFHEIIDDSLRFQQLYLQRTRNPNAATQGLRIAYQGADGDFSHLAARKFFADREELSTFTGYPTFAEVIQAVERGMGDYGLLPVENTTAGVIQEVYDLLLRTKLSIVGEEVLHIRHCLVAIEEVPLSKIRRVLAQWQVLGECGLFLARLENCLKEPVVDTATAVQRVKEDQDLSQAAIASEEAAHMHGLRILERVIGDHPENLTRFIVVARQRVTVDLRIPAKTSLIIATPHAAGALMQALVVMQRHGINMTKLESRPRKGSRFEYLFYIDFEGNMAEPRVEEALVELRGATSFLKILGSYPRENREKTAPTAQTLAGQRAADTDSAPHTGDVAAAPADTAPACKSYRLTSRDTKHQDTVLRVGNLQVGGAQLIIMAGPRAWESPEQIMACARRVKECGGQVLCGGYSSGNVLPHGVAGFAGERLQVLSEAGRQWGLPVMTEVLAPSDVERAVALADILLIGPQNMHNYPLLSEVGGIDRAVVVQRGPAASLEQLLDAAEFVMTRGNQQVMLCEHGSHTLEATSRETLDLAGISILKRLTHLPILADPSRAARQPDLVLPLALASRAMGAHALIIEIHPQPSPRDGNPALDFAAFRGLVAALHT